MSTPAFPHDHRPFGERTLTVDNSEQPYFTQVFWAGIAICSYLPSTVIPTGPDGDGLPIGVQIIGPEFGDLKTIGLAKLLEAEGFAFTPRTGVFVGAALVPARARSQRKAPSTRAVSRQRNCKRDPQGRAGTPQPVPEAPQNRPLRRGLFLGRLLVLVEEVVFLDALAGRRVRSRPPGRSLRHGSRPSGCGCSPPGGPGTGDRAR